MVSIELKESVWKSLRGSSVLFLKRGIQELRNHTSYDRTTLTNEGAKFSYIFFQTSIELACKAYLVKRNRLQEIVKKKKSDNDILEETIILERLENNTLDFISFEKIKHILKEKMTDEQYEMIEDFQHKRNKIIHFDLKFSEADLIDLNYDFIYFIVHVLLPILAEKDGFDEFYYPNTPSEIYDGILSKEDFLNLISLPLYIERMYMEALKESKNVYQCPFCRRECFGIQERKCYCCGFDDEIQLEFTDCYWCESSNSVAYDVLNLESNDNFIWKTKCLNCNEDCSVYVCHNCENAYSFIDTFPKCTPEYCSTYNEELQKVFEPSS
ncbi:hypothetical protein [Sporosarcina sp. BP05]|uniref:hypothetical protein n=1 Tax=Sporosarcina sp. BP05 TaxID=2758726 RepID=UPI0016478843|nr:hypothetical protein [Sporosarcina sp. BP05]